jgi:hypothetical protein
LVDKILFSKQNPIQISLHRDRRGGFVIEQAESAFYKIKKQAAKLDGAMSLRRPGKNEPLKAALTEMVDAMSHLDPKDRLANRLLHAVFSSDAPETDRAIDEFIERMAALKDSLDMAHQPEIDFVRSRVSMMVKCSDV